MAPRRTGFPRPFGILSLLRPRTGALRLGRASQRLISKRSRRGAGSGKGWRIIRQPQAAIQRAFQIAATNQNAEDSILRALLPRRIGGDDPAIGVPPAQRPACGPADGNNLHGGAGRPLVMGGAGRPAGCRRGRDRPRRGLPGGFGCWPVRWHRGFRRGRQRLPGRAGGRQNHPAREKVPSRQRP